MTQPRANGSSSPSPPRPAPTGAPAPKPTKPREPDAELEGRSVQVRLNDGKVLGGVVERVSTYMVVPRLADGRQARVYKHAIAYIV